MNIAADLVVKFILCFILGAVVGALIYPESIGSFVAHAVKSYNVEMSK